MIELLAPAGSMEALKAAVQNGADAVYLGVGTFNARANAKNFTLDDLAEAVAYCHIRGVRVHLTLNTLLSDRECQKAKELIASAARCGVDAFIVQDPGTVGLCRAIAPQVEVHASTQMSIHNLDGVMQAAKLGCSRAVLARELPKEEIAYICKHSPIEIEVFVHGALCMCYSGQCYFSSVVGRRSGNRGQCAQPCRLPYGYGHKENRYPLSLKDNCLIDSLEELKSMGVASLKIEGRMKKPEYVAVVTDIYRRALDQGSVSEESTRALEAVFSRQGFTRGFYDGAVGKSMLGTRQDIGEDKALLAQARASYEQGEHRRVAVRFTVRVQPDQPCSLIAEDAAGHRTECFGPVPEAARTKALDFQEVSARLQKTGGTAYYVESITGTVAEGLSLSAASLNNLRRDALEVLSQLRAQTVCTLGDAPALPTETLQVAQSPCLTVSVLRAEQLTKALLAANPRVIYLPLRELMNNPQLCKSIPEGTELCPVLPRVILDRELPHIEKQLTAARNLGIGSCLCGNTGHVAMLQRLQFAVRGDFGLNVYSSYALKHLKEQELLSATVSFEATLPQIRDMAKPLNCELIIYGRLPLMLTENCIIKNRTGTCACQQGETKLIDRMGEEFYVLPDPGSCRSTILNGKKLYLLDKQQELQALGLWGLRLQFTTESAQDVDRVIQQYQSAAPMEGDGFTRGLYLRGIE